MTAPPRQIGGERGAGERDVGGVSRERVGDDRRLDAARERPALSAILAHLEPTGVAHGAGEGLDPRLVVEVGDRPRSELPRQLAGGAAELGLLRSVSGVQSTSVRSAARELG